MTRDTRKLLEGMLGDEEMPSSQEPTNAQVHPEALSEPMDDLAFARLSQSVMEAFEEVEEEAEVVALPTPASRRWMWGASTVLAMAAALMLFLRVPPSTGTVAPPKVSLTRSGGMGAQPLTKLALTVSRTSTSPGCEGVLVYALDGGQHRELVLHCTEQADGYELSGTVGKDVRLEPGTHELVILVGPGVRVPSWSAVQGVLPAGGRLGEWQVQRATVDVDGS